jgi:hypothetical protein
MPIKLNTYTQFLPLPGNNNQQLVVKNEYYFSITFLGGNYLSYSNFLQKIFGGQNEVALMAGLRLPLDGLALSNQQEPNVVLDKRTIKTGKITNIPVVLNMLTYIPAYMESIGFTFKVATTKKSDNFSSTLDVLNDNKGVLNNFIPAEIGKVLGIGKIVKDIFDKIDSNKGLIELVVNDFLITPGAAAAVNHAAATSGNNILQEGYFVILVKDEQELVSGADMQQRSAAEFVQIDDHEGNEKNIPATATTFLDLRALEQPALFTTKAPQLQYDEAGKLLTVDGKIATNTYLVFKVQRHIARGENLFAGWSKKFQEAVSILKNDFTKTPARLNELTPKVNELLGIATSLLQDDTAFTPAEKDSIFEKYRKLITAERSKFA